MAQNPLDTALRLAQVPFRLAQKAVGGLLGGGGGKAAAPPPSVPKDLDDATVARKVESALFRDRRIAKGKVDVNVADGVVWLRGEARTPQLIKLAESRAAEVPEVARVENLLHLPKTPAPSRTDTPSRQRKTQRSPKSQKRTPAKPPPITAEKPSVEAEPTPAEQSARGEGRKPSPLGSTDGGGDGEPS